MVCALRLCVFAKLHHLISGVPLTQLWEHLHAILPNHWEKCAVGDTGEPLGSVTSKFGNVSVVRSKESCKSLELISNGNAQSSELDEFIYHECLVHPALMAFEYFQNRPA